MPRETLRNFPFAYGLLSWPDRKRARGGGGGGSGGGRDRRDTPVIEAKLDKCREEERADERVKSSGEAEKRSVQMKR